VWAAKVVKSCGILTVWKLTLKSLIGAAVGSVQV
jgi:hypothetical protein